MLISDANSHMISPPRDPTLTPFFLNDSFDLKWGKRFHIWIAYKFVIFLRILNDCCFFLVVYVKFYEN